MLDSGEKLKHYLRAGAKAEAVLALINRAAIAALTNFIFILFSDILLQ
jgi:hypothetical protein